MESLDNQLHISQAAKSYLFESAKWGKFLSIVGFVMSGLLVLLGLFMGTIFGMLSTYSPNPLPFPSFLIGIFYIGIALLYIFPCLYLYRFATQTKDALASNDSDTLTTALMNHKSLFKFMGICTIVVLCLYALILVFAIIGGAFLAANR